MPEWPDLHVLRSRIEKAVGGRRVTAVRVHDPLVLRATRPLDEALAGRTLTGVAHRGRFLAFAFDDGTRVVVGGVLVRDDLHAGHQEGRIERSIGDTPLHVPAGHADFVQHIAVRSHNRMV